jgi:hypothetical protein
MPGSGIGRAVRIMARRFSEQVNQAWRLNLTAARLTAPSPPSTRDCRLTLKISPHPKARAS